MTSRIVILNLPMSLQTQLTELCKNIPVKFRESPSKCSAAHPKNPLVQYFRQPFPKDGRDVFTLLCCLLIVLGLCLHCRISEGIANMLMLHHHRDGLIAQSARGDRKQGRRDRRGCKQMYLLQSRRVGFSESGPTLHLVQGRAKPVLQGVNSTESYLFHHGETTYRAG